MVAESIPDKAFTCFSALPLEIRERIWHFALFPPPSPTTLTPNTLRSLYFLHLTTPGHPALSPYPSPPMYPHLTITSSKGYGIGATTSLIRETLPSRTLLSTVSESRRYTLAALPLAITVGPRSTGPKFRFHPEVDQIVLGMVHLCQFLSFQHAFGGMLHSVLQEQFGMPVDWEVQGTMNRFGLALSRPTSLFSAILFIKDAIYVELPSPPIPARGDDGTETATEPEAETKTEMVMKTAAKTGMVRECIAFPFHGGTLPIGNGSISACEICPAITKMARVSNYYPDTQGTVSRLRGVLNTYRFWRSWASEPGQPKLWTPEKRLLMCERCSVWARTGEPKTPVVDYLAPDFVETTKVLFP